MKVLILNTNNSAGGATKACVRLHQSLLKIKVDTQLLMLEQPTSNIVNANSFYSFYLNQQNQINAKKNIFTNLFDKVAYRLNITKEAQIETEQRKQQKLLSERLPSLEVFTFNTSWYHIQEHPLYKEADIIHLHWVADNFLDYEDFFLNNKKPIVWTLHDTNPFTGGCHYSEGCQNFIKNCENCPQLEGTSDNNYAAKALKKKINSFEHIEKQKIAIVSPSIWLMEESKKSALFKDLPHYHIPYGIDSQIFRPQDKAYARQILGIPLDKIVILFVAYHTQNKRKGYHILKESFQKLNNQENLLICSVGSKNNERSEMSNYYELGSFSDEITMSLVYSAADVFVIPSLEDNLPNTVIESLLCGTPVIGFPVGGIIDMIIDEQNGYLTKDTSADSLRNTLDNFLNTYQKFDRTRIREDSLIKYDNQIQAEKYLDLYNSLIK